VDLQAVKASISVWTWNLKGDIMDTKKNFDEAIVNMRNGLHRELNLMFQVEAKTMKAEIRTSQERMEAKIEATPRKFQTW
jgi:hypothetical protein